MKIQAKKTAAPAPVKKSEWEVVSLDTLPVSTRSREMSPETKEILDRVLALEKGQALRIPAKYVIEREANFNGKEYVLRSFTGAPTIGRHLEARGLCYRTRWDGSGLWVFVKDKPPRKPKQ